MNRKLILAIGFLLSVSLGSVIGNVLLFLGFGTTLISGIATVTGFLGYLVTDLTCYKLSKDKNVTE